MRQCRWHVFFFGRCSGVWKVQQAAAMRSHNTHEITCLFNPRMVIVSFWHRFPPTFHYNLWTRRPIWMWIKTFFFLYKCNNDEELKQKKVAHETGDIQWFLVFFRRCPIHRVKWMNLKRHLVDVWILPKPPINTKSKQYFYNPIETEQN